MKKTVKLLKSELWKLFHSPMLYISLLIGFSFAMLDVWINIGKVQGFINSFLRQISNGMPYNGHIGYSLFILSMPYGGGTEFASSMFYLIWPILATLPFGWSYFQERKSGLYNQIVTRGGAGSYIVAKYLAVFTGGGIGAALPVLFNLLANALVLPYAIPNSLDPLGPIVNGHFLSALYFTNPWLHGIIWCGVTFLFGGVTAGLCFLLGTRPRFTLVVLLTPFLLYFGTYMLERLAESFVRSQRLELSPLMLANVATDYPNPEWLVFTELMILGLLSLAGCFWEVKKHELA